MNWRIKRLFGNSYPVLLGCLFACCADPAGSQSLSAPNNGPRLVNAGQTVTSQPFDVVNVEPDVPVTTKIAVQACAGLYNGKRGGSVYVKVIQKDLDWLDLLSLVPSKTVAATAFLTTCLQEFRKSVKYTYSTQQKLLPNILTVGAVLEAVPLDEQMAVDFGQVVFNATDEFATRTPLSATKYVYDNFVDSTTGLAAVNPGYCDFDCPQVIPQIVRDMNPSMIDFVFSKKLFSFYLPDGCTPSTPENRLLDRIAGKNPWPKPLAVYGYNNTWMLLGGYIHEAMTNCVSASNMGAVPILDNHGRTTVNLSFFSTRRAPITKPGEVQQNSAKNTVFDPNKTYVAFIIGDGDNISFMLDDRRNWFNDRIAACQRAANSCAPITWTMSPHLNRIAPDVLEWYSDRSHKTGKDYFTLPPSGYLYSYPGALAEEVQDEYVSYTEEAAEILGTRSTVHWEWSGTWKHAEEVFLPKYATKDGTIRGIFPTNVPYVIPILTWKTGQFHKIIKGHDGGRAVLFRPKSWRGVDNSGDFLTQECFLSPDKRVEEINAYPRGTVAAIYMTSDGGLTLSNSFTELVKILPPHVELVSADTATRLALDAWDWRQSGSPTCDDGILNRDEQGIDCGGQICRPCSPEPEICAGFDYDQDGLADEDCLGSLVTVGDYDTGLVPDGDGGGGPHYANCDEQGTVITSLGAFTGDFFDRIAGDCSTINVKVLGVDSFQTVITPNGGTPMIGAGGEKGIRASCGPNEALVGFDVWDHKPNLFAPNVVDTLGPICREVRWSGGKIDLGGEVARGTIGEGGKGPYQLRCGGDRVAKGIFMKTGAWVDSIGLKCADLQFVMR